MKWNSFGDGAARTLRYKVLDGGRRTPEACPRAKRWNSDSTEKKSAEIFFGVCVEYEKAKRGDF